MPEQAGAQKSSFRRAKSRASRACEVCHARKVRCDVTVHMPCTNCAAFGCECRIPEVKSRKSKTSTTHDKKPAQQQQQSQPSQQQHHQPRVKLEQGLDSASKGPSLVDKFGTDSALSTDNNNNHATSANISTGSNTNNTNNNNNDNSNATAGKSASDSSDGDQTSARSSTGASSANPNGTHSDSWFHLFDSKVQGPGRVAFLGSTSNFNLLLQDSSSESYHYSLPTENGGRSRLSEMEKEELDVLKIRGAFLLPSREVCDDIVECYFEKVHPIIPVINRAQFMRQYNDPINPPSLLLFQSLLLAGSRVCHNPALKDATGSSELATLTFYKRAKALYDANYELDRISLVQSTLLMGWWWENPEEVTKNVYYWTRVSISIAQGFGIHRSVENSKMSAMDKKMWKRIWWSLFVRDRSVAMALGRPAMINLDDCDVPMITEDDLNEDEPGLPSPYPTNRVQVLFFINSVKLSEIIGYILRQQFSVGAERSRKQNKYPSISYCDMAMASWMKNLPEELRFSVSDSRNYDFYRALLHSQYYTVLCLVHRTNVIDRRSEELTVKSKEYPSWGIAFQSAHMICLIAEQLKAFNDLEDCPAFMNYTLFSALIILLYQTESRSKAVAERAHVAIKSLVSSMETLGKTWLVARMIQKLFVRIKDNPKIKEKIVHPAKKMAAHSSSSKRPLDDADEEETSSNKRPANGDSGGIFREYPVLAGKQKHVTPNTIIQKGPNDQSFTASPVGGLPPGATSGASSGHSPSASKTGPSPEFHFVTNTSPSTQTGFLENFQPSQLFPESQGESVNLQQGMSSSSSSTPNVDGNHSKLQAASGLSPSMLQSGPQDHLGLSPPADGVGTPSSLSLGDWYQFLVNNTDGQFSQVGSIVDLL